ncbi:polysaccharide biosynthesis/export family protein [Novosphingobium jiangmenense]|uniref:Polysaccharide export protein n=1 Tax=Novosphingobium jiangmenense TaxID=2791981 RepID=A0ABS0HBL2_9SPHN|nr:polysaccharide biosynthesis/export family protein [Novosphingobium jiangmenense]MBF9149672.1 polysaccharide export protein [Novosphingobium jiangmenense]
MRIVVVILSFLTCLSLPLQQAAAQTAASADTVLAGAEAGVAQGVGDSGVEVAYRFGSGDKLRIRVYNEDTISGDYEVDSTGNLSLQLLGQVKAVGLTLTELSALIERRLREEGYMIAPKVAIDVLNYRPFYVLGEVGKPGSYPYVAGMTVLNAIALAGGYTYRAKQSKFELIRGPDNKKVSVDVNATVLPGDIIKVNERFF